MSVDRCPIGCAVRCGPKEICWFNGNDDVRSLLDREALRRRERVSVVLQEHGRQDLAEDFRAHMRDLDTGIYGAASTWSALSSAQKRALVEAEKHGGRLELVGKEYRHGARNQPYKAVFVATVRNLCSRELMAWEGGAFRPEDAAVVTERGRFVIKHGEDR